MVGKRGANKSAAKPTLRDQADQLRRAGHFARALEVYEAYLKEQPDDYQALLDQGSVLMSLERFADAAQVYSKMVQIKPNETVLSNLGAALIRLGRANEAKVVLDYALEINPKNINARINLGGVLQALGMPKESLQNALEAVSIDPTQPLAFNNLGSALFDLAKFPEAKHAFETAILLDSKNLDAQINIANIESKLGSPQASIEAYKKALSLLPTEAKQRAEAIRFYMSFEYLKQGILPEGWDCYEGGFSNLVPVAGARHPRRNFSVPRWNGEALNGKTLLVWREQGLGDELLFATCLHELEALGGKIVVECDRRLVETFTRSFPHYTVRAEAFLPEQAMQSPYKDFDLHVPLGSLMKYFRRDIKDFERSGAYIKTDPAKVAKFAERLAPYKEDYRLVGICWRSGKLDPVRNLGYTTLDEWGEVLQTPGFKFVNLQCGECEEELKEAEQKYGVEILRWPDLNLKDDLDDVFALMHCLDAVSSVQTAVLVMGGGVGVPTVGVKAGGWTTLGQQIQPWFSKVFNTVESAQIRREIFNATEFTIADAVSANSYLIIKGTASDKAKFNSAMLIAKMAAANGDWSVSNTHLQIAQDIDRLQTLRDLPEFAWRSFLDGKIGQADELAASALEYFDPELYEKYQLQRVLAECGHVEEAIALADTILKERPDSKALYSSIAESLLTDERWEEAAELFERQSRVRSLTQPDLYSYIFALSRFKNANDVYENVMGFYQKTQNRYFGLLSVLALMSVDRFGFEQSDDWSRRDDEMGRGNGHTTRYSLISQSINRASPSLDSVLQRGEFPNSRFIKFVLLDLALCDLAFDRTIPSLSKVVYSNTIAPSFPCLFDSIADVIKGDLETAERRVTEFYRGSIGNWTTKNGFLPLHFSEKRKGKERAHFTNRDAERRRFRNVGWHRALMDQFQN
jgi:tetratricopeptide (TPR) repeat protein